MKTRAWISHESPQQPGWKRGSAWGRGGVMWISYCLSLCPDTMLYLRHLGGSSLTSARLLQSVWFPWQKTTTDNWPGSHGSGALKTAVQAETGRKVHWWLLFALLINVRPGSPRSRGLTGRHGLSVYIYQFPELSFLSPPIIWATRPSDTYTPYIRSIEGDKLCDIAQLTFQSSISSSVIPLVK